jgi:hypothetical protein
MFWIGLVLMLIVVVGRERVGGWLLDLTAAVRGFTRRMFGRRLASSPQDPR